MGIKLQKKYYKLWLLDGIEKKSNFYKRIKNKN